MESHISSYPSIYNLGHSAIKELLFDANILVEEKVDGSQFSFRKIVEHLDSPKNAVRHTLVCRSKNQEIDLANPGMFAKAVDWIQENVYNLHDDWTYRGEFLSKPKHNTLAYARVPVGNIILFDIEVYDQGFMTRKHKEEEAKRIGLEIVPLIATAIPSMDVLKTALETISILGGQKIEGVVIKNYNRFGRDKKVLMGKFVSEEFKEIHGKDWKLRNPTHGDIIETIGNSLRSPARWNKAIQHLKERGESTNSVKDIGKLIKEIQEDTFNEESWNIIDSLMNYATPKINKIIVKGFPEWFKEKLASEQFENDNKHDKKLEDGDICPFINCGGILIFKQSENCSCHIVSPCPSCVESPLICSNCAEEFK